MKRVHYGPLVNEAVRVGDPRHVASQLRLLSEACNEGVETRRERVDKVPTRIMQVNATAESTEGRTSNLVLRMRRRRV